MLDLTQSQSNFVFSNDKFIRLLAPAGCGKTSVLIEKARNIRKNNPKSRIMIFTFTRGAADELREHCDKDVSISVSTLNSWGNDYIKLDTIKNAKIIQKHSDKLLCVKNILQPVWGKKIYEKTFKKILSSGQKNKKAEMIMDLIDGFKNIGFIHNVFNGKQEHDQEIYDNHIEYIKSVGLERYYNIMISDLIHTLGISEEEKHEAIVKIWIPFWKDCCDQMRASGLYTFDDQKYLANITLSEKVKNGEQWNGVTKMDYIFIDEFQDISPLDSMLITNLQKLNNADLVIVGDDDQAIYEFRGASPYFILHPDEIFNQKFTTFILDKNFRSPENIVTKATKLISHNINRVPKTVISSSKDKPAEITVNAYETQEEMVEMRL